MSSKKSAPTAKTKTVETVKTQLSTDALLKKAQESKQRDEQNALNEIKAVCEKWKVQLIASPFIQNGQVLARPVVKAL